MQTILEFMPVYKMLRKSLFLLIFLFLVYSLAFAQAAKKIVNRGIVNGAATYLPKPDYPQEAKDFCADGKVEVEVLISEKGNVIKAKAISGDELLHEVSVEAAKKAKFRQMVDAVPVKMKGIVVYNFPRERMCIEKGVINSSALNIPKPQVANLNHPKHLRILKEETVRVQVVIRASTGDVMRARAISGHPVLRSACEYSARKTKFRLTNDVTFDLRVKGVIVYKFNPDGTVETNIRNTTTQINPSKSQLLRILDITNNNSSPKVGSRYPLLNMLAVYLPKPEYPPAAKAVNASGMVMVLVVVDEQGNVESAKAQSGHPLLRGEAVKSALAAKFKPVKNSGKPIKITGLLAYNFTVW